MQVYKRDKLEKVAQKILHDSGFNAHTTQQIKSQLLAQEGIFIKKQTIANYLHDYLYNDLDLVNKVEEIVTTDPDNIYSDEQISLYVKEETGVHISSNEIPKIRKHLGIPDEQQRRTAKLLENAVKEVIAGEKTYNPYPDSKIAEIVSTKTGSE